MFEPIHKHLLIKAKVRSPLTDEEEGNKMLEDLVELVGMKPVTEARSTYVEDAGNEGLTGSINLATSHIAYHIWDGNGMLMLDLYSCKDFESQDVIVFLDDIMLIETMHAVVLDRETFEIIEEYVV